MLFVVTPRASDIDRFLKSGPARRFNALLDRITTKHATVRILDLLTHFAARSDIDAFYNDCDGHWTPEGTAAASEIILRSPNYQSLF